MKNLLIILLIVSTLYAVDMHGNQQFLKQDAPAPLPPAPAPLPPGAVEQRQFIEMRMNNKPSPKKSWQIYFDAKVVANEVDYMNIEKLLLEVQLDNKSAPTLLPYQNIFKVGAGYNVDDNSMRASPFISEVLYNSEPHSFEGTDGTITQAIYTSAKDFAMDISLKAAGKYKGFGVKAAASFSMDSSYSIQSNEVVLKATHKIDHGKSIYTQNHLKLTKEAKTSLATDQQEFINAYGSHFIVGFTQECEMDVYYRRKTTSTDKKMDVALAMSVDTKFWDANGSLDVSSSRQEKRDQTTVQVKYSGTSGDKYIQGLNMQQLEAAILEFPNVCDGNIANYILWPYAALSDYQNVLSTIRVTKDIASLLAAEEAARLAEEARLAAEEEEAARLEAEEEANEADALEQSEANVLETPTDAVNVLDTLYTTAILEVKIIKNSINAVKAYNTHQSQEKKDRVFELDLYEMVLYDQYQYYKAKLEISTQRMNDIKKLRSAKNEIDSGRLTVLNSANGKTMELDAIEEHRESLEEDNCNVYLCEKCTSLSNARCEACEAGSTLTDDGQCRGWMLLFKQSAGTYHSSEDWLKVHDTEHGQYLDNYSILHKLDDSMRNSEYKFNFLMRWDKDFEYKTYQMWEQLSNPVTETDVRGFKLNENSNYTDHFFAGLVKNEEDFSVMLAAGAPDSITNKWWLRSFSIGTAWGFDGVMLPGPRAGQGMSPTVGHNCRSIKDSLKCSKCEGSCDDATQCLGKLECRIRHGGSQAVTGCPGASGFEAGTNFCFDPLEKEKVQQVKLFVEVGRGEGVDEIYSF